MKLLTLSVITIVGILLLGLVVRIIWFPVNTATKLVDTAYQAQDKTLNADNAIYNYEWFKQQYQDIEASKAQLNNATVAYGAFVESAGPRENWDREDKIEESRLRTVKLGLENYLATQIANYNARASMANRAMFQNSIVPGYIDALTFIKK